MASTDGLRAGSDLKLEGLSVHKVAFVDKDLEWIQGAGLNEAGSLL